MSLRVFKRRNEKSGSDSFFVIPFEQKNNVINNKFSKAISSNKCVLVFPGVKFTAFIKIYFHRMKSSFLLSNPLGLSPIIGK
jgi:hypothetical protein